jgi:hypothetical protein
MIVQYWKFWEFSFITFANYSDWSEYFNRTNWTPIELAGTACTAIVWGALYLKLIWFSSIESLLLIERFPFNYKYYRLQHVRINGGEWNTNRSLPAQSWTNDSNHRWLCCCHILTRPAMIDKLDVSPLRSPGWLCRRCRNGELGEPSGNWT